jgi:phosphoglycolate phosphatase-like HAD superfamily hydrolase
VLGGARYSRPQRMPRTRRLPAQALRTTLLLGTAAALCSSAFLLAARGEGDVLPSWTDSGAKRAIVGFVTQAATAGGPRFIAEPERIAVFDNDGTLWAEQPLYVQFIFALDRIKALAPQHPEWRTTQPFKAAIEGDVAALGAAGEHGLMELMAASHVGNTTEEFAAIVEDWIAKARHPQSSKPYTEMVYAPMIELLAYLRQHGFKTYIVSGGGVEFMRPWVERVYGVPPEQVVGSRAAVQYGLRDGKPVLLRLPKIDLVDDKAGKPVGIHQVIGRRPVIAVGNSDGDFEMLEWTTSGAGSRLGVIVHHTDRDREWAYDRQSHIGRLARALDEAPARGWVVVDMKQDWQRSYR